MPSAYELMLVLRGRNYLSNDLRRAGSDLRRLGGQGALESQRKQLQINAQRLAGTRAIAQAELTSINQGTRRLRLDQATNALKERQLAATDKLVAAQTELDGATRAQVANSEKLVALQAEMSSRQDLGSGGYARLREQVVQLTAANEVLIAQQNELAAAVLKAEATMAKLGVKEQELTARGVELAARQSVLTDRINTTTAAEELNTKKLDENALAMRRLPLEQLGARARYVEHLGRTFQTFGLIATAALGLAAHQASKFETELTLASTQATLVGNRTTATVQANSRQIQASIQQMLNKGTAVASPTDLNQGLYSIYSGITLKGNQRQQIQQGINILKQFQHVYTANFGQVEFNDVVRAGIALINSFGLSTRTLPGVLNRMQASVRFGALTMGDFVGSLNQVVPAYKSAHLSFDNLAGDVATVSRLFPNLRFGTTGLARLLEQLGKTKTIQGLKDQFHIDIAPQGKLLPLLQIIQMIAKAEPSLTKGGVAAQNFFKSVSGEQGTIQSRRVFAQLISSIGLYRTVSGQVIGDNKELKKSFEDMSQTPQVRWAEFTNQLRGLILEIGTHALPVFTEMAGPIEKLVHWFDNLSPSTQKLIVRFTVWASIIAAVGGTVLVIVGAFTRMYVAIRLLLLGKAGVAALEEGFIGAGTALRVGFIGAVLLAIPLLIRYHSQIGNVIQKLGGLKDVLLILSAAFAAFRLTGAIAMFTAATAAANVFRLMMLRVAAIGIITVGIELVVHRAAAAKALDDFFSHIPGYNKSAAHDFFSGIAGTDAASAAKAASNAAFQTNADRIFGTPGHKQTRASLDNQDIYGVGPAKNLPIPKMDNTIKVLKQARQVAGLVSEHGNNLITYVSKNQFKSSSTGGNGGNGASAFNVQDAIANVEKLRAAASKAPTIANYTAYEKALTALQKHFKGDQLTALNDYLNNIESTEKKSNSNRLSEEKKAESARKKAVKAAQAEILKDAQALQNSYQQFYSTNQSAFGTLFNGPHVNSPMVQNRLQYGAKLTGKDLLADIRSQVHAFRQWRGLLAQLRRRGITGDLYDQIVQAGPGSIDDVRALLSLSKTDLRTYAKTFASGENLIAQATQQDMNLSLVRYRQYGRNIALQIIEGMRDEHTPATKVFEDMIKKQFPGLANKAGKGSSSPSSSVTSTVKPNGPGGSVVIAQHDHYHVNAPRTEHSSIQTQLRHATFASRTKRLKKPLK